MEILTSILNSAAAVCLLSSKHCCNLAFSSNRSFPIRMTSKFHLARPKRKLTSFAGCFFYNLVSFSVLLSFSMYIVRISYHSLCTARKISISKGEKKETWDDKHANRREVEKIFLLFRERNLIETRS